MPTARHRCNISSKVPVLQAGATSRSWAPPARYTPRSNTANIRKDLIKIATLTPKKENSSPLLNEKMTLIFQ